VPSATGFGVGLQQSAQLASRVGFTLSLAANRAGEVRFELRRDDTGTRQEQAVGCPR
jgi:hypothetical protein